MKAIGILSPGDMGHTVGQRLKANGLRVVAQLADRSERTRQLAANAGIEEVSSYEALVEEADIVLCILVPAEAEAAAKTVAASLRRTGADLLYADCNAIAPQTTKKIGETISDAGGRFVDASIIGAAASRGGDDPILRVRRPRKGIGTVGGLWSGCAGYQRPRRRCVRYQNVLRRIDKGV